ncbi:hypothetical protein PTKIN_Ptkin02bG0253400 [Pterospermum kingtungense]
MDSESETQNGGLTTLLDYKSKKARKFVADSDLCLVGPPIKADEARLRWPLRYQSKNRVKKQSVTDTSNELINTRTFHNVSLSLYLLKAKPIVMSSEEEVLQARNHYEEAMVDGCRYKLGDNAYVKVINKDNAHLIDKRRVLLSDIHDDNPLNCIISKVEIAQVAPDIELIAEKSKILQSGLYYNMKYSLPHLTFINIVTETLKRDSDTSSVVSNGSGSTECGSSNSTSNVQRFDKSQKYLLDLYSGCGTMSTGLCMGASLSSVNVVTGWAVDINSDACKSLKWIHPETKEWEKLCQKFSLLESEKPLESSETCDEDDDCQGCDGEEEKEEKDDRCFDDSSEDFEVERLLDVRWKGYDASYDTLETITGLSICQESLKEFVTKGYKSNILPLPFAKGFLGRYAVGRLVSMNYQARMGMMAAGSYGVPQFRMRVFLWGSHHSEKLPQYPLPTHEVFARGQIPKEFEELHVAYDKKDSPRLETALNLRDAISDLPPLIMMRVKIKGSMGQVLEQNFKNLLDCQGKGANFRDLPGVVVNENNKVVWDTTMESVAQIWETIGASLCHEICQREVNQCVIHPSQDIVLTICENARLQGFPNCYKLFGSIKERYMQVGNAVAVPVATALGYAFGLACQGLSDDDESLMILSSFQIVLPVLHKQEMMISLIEEVAPSKFHLIPFGCVAQYTIMPTFGYVISVGLYLLVALEVLHPMCLLIHYGTQNKLLHSSKDTFILFAEVALQVMYIARGDVPLSTVMTVCTTLRAVILTPLLTMILAGNYVPVDAIGLSTSTPQVVVAPILLGSYIQSSLPFVVKIITPFAPLFAVLASSLLACSVFSENVVCFKSSKVNASMASDASLIDHLLSLLSGELGVVILSVLLLHFAGFFVGSISAAICRFREPEWRAISIEAGMRNSSLGVVLATSHFTSPVGALPPAMSAIIMNIMGSSLGFIWRQISLDSSTSGQVLDKE